MGSPCLAQRCTAAKGLRGCLQGFQMLQPCMVYREISAVCVWVFFSRDGQKRIPLPRHLIGQSIVTVETTLLAEQLVGGRLSFQSDASCFCFTLALWILQHLIASTSSYSQLASFPGCWLEVVPHVMSYTADGRQPSGGQQEDKSNYKLHHYGYFSTIILQLSQCTAAIIMGKVRLS